MKSVFLAFAVAVSCASFAAPAPQTYVAPRFNETFAERRAKAATVTAEIDRIFLDFAAERRVPGLVWGVVLDGELVHQGAHGLAKVEKKISAAADTRFRIASMSKSFTALAIMKLRDAGKLNLFDPVEKFLPDFRGVHRLSTDSPPITGLEHAALPHFFVRDRDGLLHHGWLPIPEVDQEIPCEVAEAEREQDAAMQPR